MKKLLTLIVPAALLAVVVGFALAPAQANASPTDPVSHTNTRSCGDHCHHHGHYWNCGGCTYYCPGHR